MADDLGRLMDAVESEGPSPEFVATLRARIVAETSQRPEATLRSGATPDERVVEIQPQETDRRSTARTRWVLVGAAAAAVALIVGLVVFSRGDDDGGLEMIDTPREPTSTEVAPEPPPEPAVFVAGAPRLTASHSLLEEGTHLVDTVGTSFTFVVDRPLWVAPNGSGLFVLAHPQNQGGGDRDIVFTRMSDLVDPTRPTESFEDPAGWPADDFGGWLDRLSDDIAISNRAETTLGGLPAIRVDLELPDCGTTEPCALVGVNHSATSIDLFGGSINRVWMVDQGERAPLAVAVRIARDVDRDWLQTAEQVLSTLAFGDVAPNPILAPGPGPVDLPFLGGIRIELPQSVFAERDPLGFGSVELDEWPGGTQFLAIPLDLAGDPVESADDLVAALVAAGAGEVTEVEPTTVGGFEARVFDLVDGSTKAALKFAAAAEDGWWAPMGGRLWVIDHPDRGVLVVTAEAFENVDIVLPLALAQTDAIIESLAFVDLG